MYCSLHRLIVQPRFRFPCSSPEALHISRRERPLLAKGGIMGEKCPIKFSLAIAISMVNAGFFYMPQSCDTDKRLYFPSEERHAEEFCARKIRRLRPGFEPVNLGTRGQNGN